MVKEPDQTPKKEDPGIRCPHCGCARMAAYATRRKRNDNMRSRRCKSCGKRVRTKESIIQILDN